ncbi:MULTISPECIES: phosphotransferase [unclassified Mesorhizobium]|uniref:phosphotransferase n=1 Tax=Mesorhizobium sp. BR-1-1-10 TaxID=2876660 RepID=UPI001AEEBDAD|nr:phosphotransferase [Mesorhizobium sp. BR-1-1-10]
MAVYTELSVDEVAAFFGALGLGWPRSVRGITTGIENTNYFVDTESGEYVLTLFERLTFEQFPFYLHLIKHLAARRMPVPNPVANARGEILHSLKGRPAVVVNRLPGESLTAPTVSHCRSIGDILAQIHLAEPITHDTRSICGGSNGGTKWCRWSANTCPMNNGRCSPAS